MIVRVLRARVRAGRVGPFNALFRRQVTLLREQPGLLYVKLARRLQPDGGEEAVLFEEWQDAASLYAWVGPNLAEPRLVPGIRELVEDIHVAHYEVLAEDLDTPPVAGEGSAGGGGGLTASEAGSSGATGASGLGSSKDATGAVQER